ncbi:branched-chain amino acid ABC transporter substrate-binding protein [Mesorhizobium sp. YR577]|uniref:branched-chain amino acid ABC transporter substrate-binding protein n=1 Tax=Mesorhizobium sp. YR577 TaxID=1884373 RepID=UPI001587DC57|nr:branched-chain amino acid ABC transporter substrate-binding protein [Mesorhizobium sp. YR577]
MRIAGFVIGALFALALAGGPARAEAMRIGVAAPLSGPSQLLGEQIRNGALEAASAPDITLEVADDTCTGEGGVNAAQRFVDAKVQIVVGFLCTESIEAALPILKQANIPVITVGVRTDSREKTGWPVFRLGPRADSEREAAGRLLTRLWRDELFAVIDDGTIYGRELAESFRTVAEQSGLKPVFTDTFRPQLDNQIGLVGRLRKAEATHVFVGGDRDDIAIMARDAKKIGTDIIFAGGENLRSAPGDVPLAQGTLMVALSEWSDMATPAAISKLGAKGIVPEGYVLPAYAATEIAIAAVTETTDTRKPLAETLDSREFSTSIGPVRFNDKGDLSANPYRLFRFDGSRFLPLDVQ